MFGEERKEKIVHYINQNNRASVAELSKEFAASEVTIRRDLKELEDANLIRRTHGGALSLESVNYEPTFLEKEESCRLEKIAIAKRAAELIENGDTILLDSGTTTYYLVQHLKAFTNLTVVTNSTSFVPILKDCPGIELIVTGGSLRSSTEALVGPITELALARMHVDKAFVATNAIDLEIGLTTPNLLEAATKKSMLQAAKQVILLADHSKLNKIAFAQVAKLEKIDIFITDDRLSPIEKKEIEKLGVEVHAVPVEE